MQVSGDISLKEVIRDLERLEKMEVRVGVFGDEAELAAVHEFGARIRVTDKMRGYLRSIGLFLKKTTEFITIPERAPLRKTASDTKWQKEVVTELRESIIDMALRKLSPKQVMERVGLVASNGVRDKITEGEGLPPANHPVTVQQKGSSRPLVDTGELARSYTFRVK